MPELPAPPAGARYPGSARAGLLQPEWKEEVLLPALSHGSSSAGWLVINSLARLRVGWVSPGSAGRVTKHLPREADAVAE